jgi:signal transduction histidine kinase
MIGRAFQVRAPKLALRIAAAKSGATSAILWIYDPKNHTFSASVVVNAASGDYVLSAGKGIVGQLTPVRSVVSFDIASPGGVRPFHPDLFDAEGWKRCTAFSICSRGLLLGAISFYWDRELSEQQPDRDRLTDISGLRIADMASGYVAADLAEIAEADEIDRLEAIIVKQGPAQALMSFMHDIQKSLRDAMTAMNAASVYLAGGNQAAKAMAVHLQESSSFINVCMNRALRLALLQQRVPAFKRVDLARLVEDLRPLIELSATVKVKSRIPKGPIFVQGDRIDIERSIFNVVENAIYWTDIKLSGERVVNVRLIRESIHAIIEVEDTGVGVGPEMRDRVFERFVTGRPESGTGMGLFLVSRVMLAHGGSVDFSDNDHGGTTFRLRFPLSERQRE